MNTAFEYTLNCKSKQNISEPVTLLIDNQLSKLDKLENLEQKSLKLEKRLEKVEKKCIKIESSLESKAGLGFLYDIDDFVSEQLRILM